MLSDLFHSNFQGMSVKKITVNWTITGYHKFRVKPKENEPVVFQREPENPYDPWAILVKLKDGRTIGRVPANLCRVLIKLKQAKSKMVMAEPVMP